MEQNHPYRVWAEINLDHLTDNFQTARRQAAGSAVCCVIKANAYGHGAAQVAQALADAGAGFFAVADFQEALLLRKHGIRQPILLLSEADPEVAATLGEQDITLTVGSLEMAKAYSQLGQPLDIQVKVDTGMHRLGLPHEGAVDRIREIAGLEGLRLVGVFSHLAASDDPAEDFYTALQIKRLGLIREELELWGVRNLCYHIANSGGLIRHPDSCFDLVRPGLMLYGHNPCGEGTIPLQPVMSLRTRALQILDVKKGETVGYNRTWTASRDSRIATVSIGYADGFSRLLSEQSELLAYGKRVPLVGRICMDMSMADVTDVPEVQPGDALTVFGVDGGEEITVEEIGLSMGTISYEVLCDVGFRVPRRYFRGGELVENCCYLEGC